MISAFVWMLKSMELQLYITSNTYQTNEFESQACTLIENSNDLTQIRLSKRLCQKPNEAWRNFC